MNKYLFDGFHKYVAGTSDDPMNIEIEKADGMHIWSPDGKRYIDLIAGISVCNMGHSHPAIVDAVKKQVNKYMHVMAYGEIIQESQVELARLLCRQLPAKLSSVFFVNSGSEAVEGGLKLAKRATGRREIVYCDKAYHGCTQGAMSVMGCESFKAAFQPLLPDTKAVRFGVIEDLKQITDKTACFIVEAVQGEAGVRIASKEYWQAVRKRCDETGALLVLDEIQTGLGRTGKLFCFEHYDIIPDILLLAKALGGGLPLGAFISSKEIMHLLTHDPALGHISTFGGHPVSCAAALAHLKLIVEGRLWEKADEKGAELEKIMLQLAGAKEVRRIGLMLAVQFADTDTNMKTFKNWLSKGIFTDWFLFCDSALRVAPPLIIGKEDFEELRKILL